MTIRERQLRKQLEEVIQLRFPKQRPNIQQDVDVVLERLKGKTLQQIADRYGLSRQAVDQRLKRLPDFIHVRVDQREALLDKTMAPYMQEVTPEPLCIVCGKVSTKKKHRYFGLCGDCSRLKRTCGEVAALVRSFKKSGDRAPLRKAWYLIKKYNISPVQLGKWA